MSAHENRYPSSYRDLAMAERQLVAKLGVVLLLGLNVGAYYLFWPKNNGRPVERAAATPSSAPTAPIPERPRDFPVAVVKNVELISAPALPVKSEKVSESADPVNRLVE